MFELQVEQMNTNLVNGFQIQARRRLEFNQDCALVFVKYGKCFKIHEDMKANNGTVMMGQNNLKLSIGIVLTREGSTLSFILHNLKNAKIVKQLRMQLENNYANYHHVTRLCNDDLSFLFYHESRPDIELRSLTFLKKRSSLSLAQICQKFNLLNYFDQIKVSLDFDSIPHLGKLALILTNKLILVKMDVIDQAEVLFDCSELSVKERLNGLRYDSEKRVLMISGMSSFFLFGFDDTSMSYSRTIDCSQFGRAIRLLGWDPHDQFILIAQRIMEDQENYHLIDYRASDPIIITFVKRQPLLGNFYDLANHRLFYIEVGGDRRKDVRIVNLRDFREKYDFEEHEKHFEIEFDTDHYTPLPPISEIYIYFFMHFLKDFLFLKPLRVYDEKMVKDFPLRM